MQVHTWFTVMRLTKPSLMTSVPVAGEPWDMLGKRSVYVRLVLYLVPRSLIGKLLEEESARDVCTTRNLPMFSVGEALTLPLNFG